MPDTKAPATVQAADAVTTSAPTPDGATPPIAAESAPKKMTAAEALAGLNRLEFKKESDWVLDEPETDILAEMERSDDPLSGLYDETEPPAEAAPEAEATAPVEAEAEAPAEDPAQDEPVVKTEADGRKRVNIFRKNADGSFVHSDITRRAMIMADEHGIDLIDALKTLGAGDQLVAKPAEAAPAKQEPTAAEIDVQLAEVEKQIDEANESLDYAALPKLEKESRALTLKRQDALLSDMQRQRAQQETQQTVQQQQEASRVKAVAAYPDAAKEGTPLNLAAQARINRIFGEGSTLMTDPDMFEAAVVLEANRLGIPPVIPPKAAPVAKPAAPAKPAVPVVAAKRATPMPAPGAVSAPPAPVSKHAELSARMKAAKAAGNLQELQKIGAEMESMFKAA